MNYRRSRGDGSLAHQRNSLAQARRLGSRSGVPIVGTPSCRWHQFVALAVAEGRKATSITSPGCTSKSSDAAILSHCWPAFRTMVTSARRSFVPIGKAPAARDGLHFLAQRLHSHP